MDSKYDKLTSAGKKLIDVLSNVENWDTNITVTELCKLADICRNTYYILQKDDDYLDAYNELADKLLKYCRPKIKVSAIKWALQKDGFRDREMLLKITGDYVPKQEIK